VGFGIASALVQPLLALGNLQPDVGVLLLNLLDHSFLGFFVEVIADGRPRVRADALLLEALPNLVDVKIVEIVPL